MTKYIKSTASGALGYGLGFTFAAFWLSLIFRDSPWTQLIRNLPTIMYEVLIIGGAILLPGAFAGLILSLSIDETKLSRWTLIWQNWIATAVAIMLFYIPLIVAPVFFFMSEANSFPPFVVYSTVLTLAFGMVHGLLIWFLRYRSFRGTLFVLASMIGFGLGGVGLSIIFWYINEKGRVPELGLLALILFGIGALGGASEGLAQQWLVESSSSREQHTPN